MSDVEGGFRDTSNSDCHLQSVGMGTLVCRAVRQSGEGTTNEVDAEMCMQCEAGRIYREIGCDAVSPKIRIHRYMCGSHAQVENLLCKVRKRNTTFEECGVCNLVTAETTREIVSTARGLFEAQGFYSSYKDLEKAREAIRDGNFDNAITRSIACLESTLRICHDKMNKPLPNAKHLTDLWKSTRAILEFDALPSSQAPVALLSALSGVVQHLGALRNSLGDAHGKGTTQPEVSESWAELAINVASTLATLTIRRFNQMKGAENE